MSNRLRDLVKPSEWSRELHVAVSVVRGVAVLAREIQERSDLDTRLKPDLSPVTAADVAVQAVVADHLARAFPADALVAEEGSALLRSQHADLASVMSFVRRLLPKATAHSVLAAIDRGTGSPADRFWTLDPVDGTEGFLNAGQYVVALALVVDGRVEIGVLGCPRLSLTPSRSRRSTAEDA